MFDETRIQRDREICEKATQGPWEVGDGSQDTYYAGKNAVASVGNRIVVERAVYGFAERNLDKEFDKQTYSDISFIALSRTELPAALDEIVRLEKELAESQKRERAAVHDLNLVMNACDSMYVCHVCADGNCENSPNCKPKWRGPMPVLDGGCE